MSAHAGIEVSNCLMDIIFAGGPTLSALQSESCAPCIPCADIGACLSAGALEKSLSSVGDVQGIEISTLVKLIQIISKFTGERWGNEPELKKILLQILLWR